MGIVPINGIRRIDALRLQEAEDAVEPLFGLERSGRMGDDAYAGSQEEAERGLEEEEAEDAPEASPNSSAPDGGVDLFA